MLETDEVVQDFRTLDPFFKLARNNKSNVKVRVREGRALHLQRANGRLKWCKISSANRKRNVSCWGTSPPHTELEGPGSHAPNDRPPRIDGMAI